MILKWIRELRDGGCVLQLHVDSIAVGVIWDALEYGLVLRALLESAQAHDYIGLLRWLT